MSQHKIGAWFAMNVPQEWKSFWAHTMVLLANGGQEEARFDPFGDSVNLVTRKVQGLHRMYHVHGNHFGHTRMLVLGNGSLFLSVGHSVSLRAR